MINKTEKKVCRNQDMCMYRAISLAADMERKKERKKEKHIHLVMIKHSERKGLTSNH